MTDEAQGPGEATLFPKTVGDRLRDARLALKLELADIAQRTRVPLRHLQAIEDGDYSGLPTPTYAVGFARAYARTVGVDEVEVAREVRGDSEANVAARRPEYQPYDIEDIPRTPSRGVMIATILAAVVVLAAALAWYNWFRGGTGGDRLRRRVARPRAARHGRHRRVPQDEIGWLPRRHHHGDRPRRRNRPVARPGIGGR